MRRKSILPFIACLALLFQVPPLHAPAFANDDDVARPAITAEQRAALRCSAAFAIVAGEQQRGVETALGYPPLMHRGGEYMALTGADLTSAGYTREEVAAMLRDAAARLQDQARESGNAAATLTAIMPPCLNLLDASVPELTTPTLGQCAAIMRLSFEEVHAADGLSDRAKDLMTLASVLEARHRRALAAKGATMAEADRAVSETLQAMRKEAEARGVGRYTVDTCFELAKPEEKTHY